MASNEDILREAEYYLNNDVTIEQASSDLGISKRTLQLHMKKLASIAPEKYKLVTDKKNNNIQNGRIVGGNIGKRSTTWTSEDAMKIASKMLDNGLTYEQAETELGIPHSTLHDMMHKGVKDENVSSLLYALAIAHKKGMSLEEFKEDYYSKINNAEKNINKEQK